MAYAIGGSATDTNGLILVSDTTLGATTQKFSATVDFDTYGYYRVVVMLESAQAGADCYIQFDGDTTAGNYYRQLLQSSNATTTSNRANNYPSFGITSGETTIIIIDAWKDINGLIKARVNTCQNNGANISLQDYALEYTPGSAVTTIDINSSIAGSINTGSRMIIWRTGS